MRTLGLTVSALLMVATAAYAGSDSSELPTSYPVAVAPAAAPCCPPTNCHGNCCERFWEWLTYQPLERVGCGCCCHCCQCCTPPLYAFFPCYGCGAGCGYAHGPAPISADVHSDNVSNGLEH